MENPYESPRSSALGEPETPPDAPSPRPRWLVKPHVVWGFLIVWNAPILIVIGCSFAPIGLFADEGTTFESTLASLRLRELAVEMTAVVQGYLLALSSYALIVSSRLRRIVFHPWVTFADVRGPLWGVAILWTILPSLYIVGRIGFAL